MCVLERYACDTTARAQGLLMSNVTVIVRKDCQMSLNSWINSKPQYMESQTGKQGFSIAFTQRDSDEGLALMSTTNS